MSNCAVSSACTSSLNRDDEWKRCCADAMGFEWVDSFDDDNDKNNDHDDGTNLKEKDVAVGFNDSKDESEEILQLTNLLDDGHDDFEDDDIFDEREDRHKHNHDVWMENALRIQADLNRMSQWIQSKKQEYIGLDMKDEEASLIQSTVTSFAATTASELETLRNMIRSSSRSNALVVNKNLSNHRAGIVQILLVQLQEQVTKPFGILQKQRVRVAVQLWQNPLQCKLYEPPPPKRRPKDSLFDEDEEDDDQGLRPKDQRFLPVRSYQQSNDNSNGGGDFISKYANKQTTSIPLASPAFLSILSNLQTMERIDKKNSPSASTPSPQQHTVVTEEEPFDDAPSSHTSDSDNTPAAQKLPQQFQTTFQGRQENQAELLHKNTELYQQQLEEDLRTESAQLTTTLIASNDLDSVHQMETRMVEITTLIGQFSNLVQDQQEQVLQVHESAKETKDNIDKGQENLIDAAERTRQSKHYKAWIILGMAAILMFFQILRN
jgi:hypothetical protein